MAEQLMFTKGALRRGLCAWMARVASSLPVPVMPVIKTELSSGAARAHREETLHHGRAAD